MTLPRKDREVLSPRERRSVVRHVFDADVNREWGRYARDDRRVLVRELIRRFLVRQLEGAPGPFLELGPGPGRFTPTLLAATRGAPLLLVDLSRPMLQSARRRSREARGRSRMVLVQGAGELLPFRSGSLGTVVCVGNILGMAGADAPALLKELRRVLRPGGRLLLEVVSPVPATRHFFETAHGQRFLLRVLREPSRYFVDRVLATGFQPYSPERLGRWEFRFHDAAQAEALLSRCGFRTRAVQAMAPLTGNAPALARIVRRDRRAWENLLKLEAEVGQRGAQLDSGFALLLSAEAVRRR